MHIQAVLSVLSEVKKYMEHEVGRESGMGDMGENEGMGM